VALVAPMVSFILFGLIAAFYIVESAFFAGSAP
jgi:hypothetical protein